MEPKVWAKRPENQWVKFSVNALDQKILTLLSLGFGIRMGMLVERLIDEHFDGSSNHPAPPTIDASLL
ncbi:hypothetical protein ACLOJK_019778 [Asimina triloba]